MQEQPGPMAAGPTIADDAFAADLYRELTEDAAETVFSPLSVAAALRMALYGARGQTAAVLARALHESPDTPAVGLRATSAAVRDAAADGSVTLRAPSIVWVQSGLPLQPGFTSQLDDAGTAGLARTGFAEAPEAARAEINRVIAGQTEGKITGLLPADAVSAATRLVLTSAVYLKAAWADPFPEAATGDAPFYPDGPERPGPDRADDA